MLHGYLFRQGVHACHCGWDLVFLGGAAYQGRRLHAQRARLPEDEEARGQRARKLAVTGSSSKAVKCLVGGIAQAILEEGVQGSPE